MVGKEWQYAAKWLQGLQRLADIPLPYVIFFMDRTVCMSYHWHGKKKNIQKIEVAGRLVRNKNYQITI